MKGEITVHEKTGRGLIDEMERISTAYFCDHIEEIINSPENDDVRCNLFSSLRSHQTRLQEEILRGLQVYQDLMNSVKSGVITDIQDIVDIQSDLLDFCDHAPGPAADFFNEFASYVCEHFTDELEIRSSFEKMLFHRKNRESEEENDECKTDAAQLQ